jgi:hypothetical protein
MFSIIGIRLLLAGLVIKRGCISGEFKWRVKFEYQTSALLFTAQGGVLAGSADSHSLNIGRYAEEARDSVS